MMTVEFCVWPRVFLTCGMLYATWVDRPFAIELHLFCPRPDPAMLAEQLGRAATGPGEVSEPRLSCRCVNADTASDALPGLQLQRLLGAAQPLMFNSLLRARCMVNHLSDFGRRGVLTGGG
eukprot:COSAG05_NODE_317_length_11545_cov_73.981391_4_plen_121_part_00